MEDDRYFEKLNRNTVLVVKDVSALQSESEKIYSYPFVIGGCCWRVGVYYKGNKFDDSLCLCLSLDVSDADFMPPGWKRHAEFSFTIVKQISEEYSQHEENVTLVNSYSFDLTKTREWFDHETRARDCANSIPLGELDAKYGGFIVDGKVKIVAEVNVLEAVGKYEVEEDLFDFHGFPVYPSEMELVGRVFEEHPDVALDFIGKKDFSTLSKRVVIHQLIILLKELRKPLQDFSFYHAHHTLVYLKYFGLNVGWLEKQVSDLKDKNQQEEILCVGYPAD